MAKRATRLVSAPSVRTATYDLESYLCIGSTPLHFAAANGHAPIVQILLTCGAVADKPDKNGMTPEALAEINGHTDVIHTLRVWEHLKLQERMSPEDGSLPTAYSDSGRMSEDESLAPSVSQADDDETMSIRHLFSRKGKERSASFSSNVSASVGVKKSLQSLLGRGVRSASGASASSAMEQIIVDGPPPPLVSEGEETAPSDTLQSPVDAVHPDAHGVSPVLARVPSGASVSSIANLGRATSNHSASASSLALTDNVAGDLTPNSTPLTRPTRHRSSSATTSIRPSLPSIFEKATHPGATFRAAMRRDRGERHRSASDTSAPIPEEEAAAKHGLFRGRVKSNESAGGKRRHGRNNLLNLFRKSNSPPSRSPSPPSPPRTADTQMDMEELDEGIEKLRQASMDLSLQVRPSSAEPTESEKVILIEATATSAPPIKTKFFPDSPAVSDDSSRSTATSPLSPTSAERPPWAVPRPRTGSEVIAPSPLANEWVHDSDSHDSDGPHASSIRRARTDAASSPRRGAASPGGTKPRSATVSSANTPPVLPPPRLPSRLVGLGWDDAADLRKVATQGSLRKESERFQAEREDGVDGDEEPEDEYHDAEDGQQAEPRAEVHEKEAVLDGALEQHDGGDSGADLFSIFSEPTSVAPSLAQTIETIVPRKPTEGIVEESTPVASDEHADEDDNDTTPEAEVDEASSLRSAHVPAESRVENEIAAPLLPPTPGRFRGASIGSYTTDSSKLSTPPGSSMRKSSIASEDMVFDRFLGERWLLYAQARPEEKPARPSALMPPSFASGFPPTVQTYADTRARGNTVSSTSTSSNSQSLPISTPATSLTPASTLSIFPPVPEHEVAAHPPTIRKISTRAEAQEVVKQNEDDILQMAQMPLSLDSSRSLAAQLAAYGESHAIEEEFAEREREAREASGDVEDDDDVVGELPEEVLRDEVVEVGSRRRGSKGKRREGVSPGPEGESSDAGSFVSAASRAGSGRSSRVSSGTGVMSSASLASVPSESRGLWGIMC